MTYKAKGMARRMSGTQKKSISILKVSENNKCSLINKFWALCGLVSMTAFPVRDRRFWKENKLYCCSKFKDELHFYWLSTISYLVTKQILSNWISFYWLVIVQTKAATLNAIKMLCMIPFNNDPQSWIWQKDLISKYFSPPDLSPLKFLSLFLACAYFWLLCSCLPHRFLCYY